MEQPVDDFRSLFESIELGVVYQDAGGQILAANASACRILRLDERTLRQRDSADPRWSAIHEDGSPFPGREHPAMLALATGKPVRGAVMGLPDRSAGETVWIRIDAFPEIKPGEERPWRVFATLTDISAFHRASRENRGLLVERDELLAEVQRRVKNSMATITGLLSLQASFQADEAAAAALEDARNRVATMQRVYESLFLSPDFRTVAVKDFLEEVLADAVAPFVGSLESPVTVGSRIMELRLDATSLFPLGLIVYELATNACKHGFPEERRGSIRVEFESRPDGGYLLRVADDGIGLPADIDLLRPQGFGLTLVQALTEQLGGRLAREPGPGTGYRIEIAPGRMN